MGSWYDGEVIFGLHYDLHAAAGDTELGSRSDARVLARQFSELGADFVQTDCKGHPGYLSWKSKLSNSSLPPHLQHDALKPWREATARLGLPLHCHYSGIWDKAAAERFPEWTIRKADGTPTEKMCPRGPYLEELMIPQFRELLTRYQVDGFWVDGDLWGVEMCYCDRCLAAWKLETGLAAAPTEFTDPEWPRWWRFQRQGFIDYVTRYCDAVHAVKPGAKVASNWLYTFRSPGEPAAPVDWISGDNAPVWGVDDSRCEARFLSTRGKPWDIMLWSFLYSGGDIRKETPWNFKPAEMLMQEASILASFGGNVQVYETTPLRDGRLVDWRLKEIAKVGRFIKPRIRLNRHSTTLPQIALLHSEHHLFATVAGESLFYSPQVKPSAGLLFALLENHYGVDVLDEWALLPRLGEFPVIAVPEMDRMSDAMAEALKRYVAGGGLLLLTGAGMFERFGADFLGCTVDRNEEDTVYSVPGRIGAAPLFSPSWALVKPGHAKPLLPLFDKAGCDRQPYPAAVVNRVGKGKVAWIPAAVGRDYQINRYLGTGEFVGKVIEKLAGRILIAVDAPPPVDAAYRVRDGRLLINLVNRANGLVSLPNQTAIDRIPPVGPIRIALPFPTAPGKPKLHFGKGKLSSSRRKDGRLVIELDRLAIHAAIEVKL